MSTVTSLVLDFVTPTRYRLCRRVRRRVPPLERVLVPARKIVVLNAVRNTFYFSTDLRIEIVLCTPYLLFIVISCYSHNWVDRKSFLRNKLLYGVSKCIRKRYRIKKRRDHKNFAFGSVTEHQSANVYNEKRSRRTVTFRIPVWNKIRVPRLRNSINNKTVNKWLPRLTHPVRVEAKRHYWPCTTDTGHPPSDDPATERRPTR